MTQIKAKPGNICAEWWYSELDVDTGIARKTRAELRRAGTTLDVLGITAVHELNIALVNAGYDLRKRKNGPDQLALIARVLAHVTEPEGKSLAHRFGEGTPPRLSRIRFDGLIKNRNPRDLGNSISRAIRIVKEGIDLQRLANDLYWWNDRIRMDWCFDYHNASIDKSEHENKEVSS